MFWFSSHSNVAAPLLATLTVSPTQAELPCLDGKSFRGSRGRGTLDTVSGITIARTWIPISASSRSSRCMQTTPAAASRPRTSSWPRSSRDRDSRSASLPCGSWARPSRRCCATSAASGSRTGDGRFSSDSRASRSTAIASSSPSAPVAFVWCRPAGVAMHARYEWFIGRSTRACTRSISRARSRRRRRRQDLVDFAASRYSWGSDTEAVVSKLLQLNDLDALCKPLPPRKCGQGNCPSTFAPVSTRVRGPRLTGQPWPLSKGPPPCSRAALRGVDDEDIQTSESRRCRRLR